MRGMRLIAMALGVGLLALPAVAERVFEPLFRLDRIEGQCRIRRPGDRAFEPAIDGYAYPLGTTVELADNAAADVLLGGGDRATLGARARVTIDAAVPGANRARVFRLERGSFRYAVPNALGADNLYQVLTPMARLEGMAGEGRLALGQDGERLALDVAPQTGALRVTGPQFTIPALAGGNQTRLVMSRDRHFLSVRNMRGTYAIRIADPDDDMPSIDLTPQMVAKFWRRQPMTGSRLVVSGLISNPDGEVLHNFAFLEAESRLPEAIWPIEPKPERSRRRGWRRLLFWRS